MLRFGSYIKQGEQRVRGISRTRNARDEEWGVNFYRIIEKGGKKEGTGRKGVRGLGLEVKRRDEVWQLEF